MLYWLILKTYPSIAEYVGWIDDGNSVRYGIYLALACLTAFSVVMRLRVGGKLFTLLFATAAILFSSVWGYHALCSDYLATGSEVTVNLRCLFLAVTLGGFLGGSRRVVAWMAALLVSYLAALQLVCLASSVDLIDTSHLLKVDDTTQRISGVYMGPWHVGYSSLVTLGAALAAAELAQKRVFRWLLYCTAAICVANMFLSINRANLPAVVVILLGWVAGKLRMAFRHKGAGGGRAVTTIAALTAAAVLACIIAIANGDVIRVYYSLWDARMEDLSNQSVRWETILAGMRMFAAHPFFGVGWDAAPTLSAAYGGPYDFTVHNTFLECAAEGGILGLSYGMLVFSIIPYILYSRTPESANRWLFAGTWIAVLFFNTVASNLHLENHWDFLFFWILIVTMERSNSSSAVTTNGIGSRAVSEAQKSMPAIKTLLHEVE